VTDIEQKALALVSQHGQFKALRVALEQHEATKQKAADTEQQLIDAMQSGIARAEAQHEAFRQEVSDAVEAYLNPNNRIYSRTLHKFIIPAPKPDPLVEAFDAVWPGIDRTMVKAIRAALEARGLEIRSKSDEG
jgi:hypothetical protein